MNSTHKSTYSSDPLLGHKESFQKEQMEPRNTKGEQTRKTPSESHWGINAYLRTPPATKGDSSRQALTALSLFPLNNACESNLRASSGLSRFNGILSTAMWFHNSKLAEGFKCRFPFSLCILAAAANFLTGRSATAVDESTKVWPLTRAESSNFEATSTHAEVMMFCEALAAQTTRVELRIFGQSSEGRELPLLIVSNKPVGSVEEAKRSGKSVILCFGNIHGGEICGKEALMMLSRDIARDADDSLLEDYILLFAPLYNADGNERVSPEHRSHQPGPREGVGERHSADGYDLNRDFVKLEAPETRSLAWLIHEWDPAIVIDTHTTNGSLHRYTLTYDVPRHPATPASIQDFLRESFLPEVSRTVKDKSGYDTFYYGNFRENHARWVSYPSLPRYSTHYLGIRNRIGILTEAHAYASYQDRVTATYEFVKQCLLSANLHKKEIQNLIREADQQSIDAGRSAHGTVPVQSQLAPFAEKMTIKGFAEKPGEHGQATAGEPHDYSAEYWGRSEILKSVDLPYAYIIPKALDKVTKTLQRHGVEVHELREDIRAEVEIYEIEEVSGTDARTKNETHLSIAVSPEQKKVQLAAGSRIVFTGQKLGRFAAFLLEPESEDGLAAWNLIGDELTTGATYPVFRLKQPLWLLTTETRALPEHQASGRRITFESLNGRDKVNFSGNPTRIAGWLGDGKQYLQIRDKRLMKVNARTGRAKPFFSSEKVAKALEKIPVLDSETAQAISRRTRYQMNPSKTGALLDHDNDLYFFQFDGSRTVRLTHTPVREELATFSPNGEFVAFVKQDNLHVVDIETQTERMLTTDGGGAIRNGKADWIYFEELFNRRWQAYWWSPDSERIAFLRSDASALPTFHALDTLPLHGDLTSMRHPKAGDPNPDVKLGVVSVAGSSVLWTDLSQYSPGDYLLSGVGWYPDGDRVFCYVQNRIQTWLDFVAWKPGQNKSERLFRDSTEAWIENPGDPHFLKGDSFLITSDRSGWNHLYRFNIEEKKWHTVTSGEWEVRQVQHVDKENGLIYFTATQDSPIAENLYRCRLDGSRMKRLTRKEGHHQISFDPSGKWFIDTWSTYRSPTQAALSLSTGKQIRMLDSNPVYALEEYDLGEAQLLQIESEDGFVFEAAIVKPPNFSPDQKYPVWFMTYAGPHAPTIRDTWSGGHARDHMLASLGMIVFRMDPRSASGKGSVSAWTAYQQLGVQELKDIEEGIEWLKQKPFVDGNRIGMSGHSYGGFMTAYAMTHSKLFAAGISGAPVTDWRYYDTIYTERYMDVPQANPEGYAKTSVVEAAKNLHGRLLLLHGMMDDNVHLQNATQFVNAMQKANVDFEVMLYPTMKHGLHGDHYQRLVFDFMKRSLGIDETE